MKKKHVFLPLSVAMASLLFVTQLFSRTDENGNTTNEFYVLTGSIESCKHIDWQDKTPGKYKTYTTPEGKRILRIKHSMPFQYCAFVLEAPDIFMISNGMATNIYTDKKVLFMQNKRRKMRTEEGWRRKCEQLVASGEKMIFYGVPHQFPEGLIQEYELEDYFIVKEYEGNFLDLPVPSEIRRKITRIRMEKHGIMLPEKKLND